MKKIIVSLCLLYAANGCAMQAVKVAGLAAVAVTPAVGFGKYNYDQTNQTQEALRKKLTAEGRTPQEIKEQVDAADSFRPYVLATLAGATSTILNEFSLFATACSAAGLATGYEIALWGNHAEETQPSVYALIASYKHAVPVAEGIGSSLTAYTIMRYSLKWLKQVPK